MIPNYVLVQNKKNYLCPPLSRFKINFRYHVVCISNFLVVLTFKPTSGKASLYLFSHFPFLFVYVNSLLFFFPSLFYVHSTFDHTSVLLVDVICQNSICTMASFIIFMNLFNTYIHCVLLQQPVIIFVREPHLYVYDVKVGCSQGMSIACAVLHTTLY